jgi:protein SCO1/2
MRGNGPRREVAHLHTRARYCAEVALVPRTDDDAGTELSRRRRHGQIVGRNELAATAKGSKRLAPVLREREVYDRPNGMKRFLAALTTLALVAAWTLPGGAHKAGKDARLSKMGPAPEFALTTQDGKRLALGDLGGKVVAVTFIYATCTDTCPMLTAKMAALQRRLGKDFGSKVFFVSVTVDPQRDTAEVLKRYAEAHGANPAGWAFLTGTPEDIRAVARRYGVYYRKAERGDVDHTFLTSIIDQHGIMRVQYLGVRFDPEEMLRDLRSLLTEASAR